MLRRGADDSLFSITRSTPDSGIAYRDVAVQWIKDLRRTIDFLETRNDVRSERLGFFAASWGSISAPVALALEPRIKAAVLYSAGYSPTATPHAEVDPPNFAPRVRTPTLMLGGRYDTVFPYETSQVPYFRHFGVKEPDKKQVISPSGHIVPADVGIAESLKWFDTYLGGGTEETASTTRPEHWRCGELGQMFELLGKLSSYRECASWRQYGSPWMVISAPRGRRRSGRPSRT